MNTTALVAANIPITALLAILFWRAADAFGRGSMRYVSLAWALSAASLVLGFWRNDLAYTVGAILEAASILFLFMAVESSSMPTRLAVRIYGVILAATYLAGTFLPANSPWRIIGATQIDQIANSAALVALGGQYGLRAFAGKIGAHVRSRVIGVGLILYGAVQFLAFWGVTFESVFGDAPMVATFVVAIIAKTLIVLGLIDLFSFAASRTSHAVGDLAGAKRTIAQLYHELGTPIAEITLRTSAILGDRGVNATVRTHAIMLENASERIKAILEATDSELFPAPTSTKHPNTAANAGRKDPSVVTVNSLLEVARMAVKDMSAMRTSSNFVVNFDLRYSARCCIEVVPSEVVQIFINLLTNSIDACEGTNGMIGIWTKAETGVGDVDTVLIQITDNGQGIPADISPRIYEDGFTTRRGPGRGHGLAVAKRLLGLNGGTIQHEDLVGGGCRVLVRFAKVACRGHREPR